MVALLTSVTREYDRVSIHGVRRVLLEAQAAALGLPLIEVWLEPKSSDAAYQRAFLDALDVLSDRHPAVHLIAFGDLYLRDVRDYRDRLLAGTPYRGLIRCGSARRACSPSVRRRRLRGDDRLRGRDADRRAVRRPRFDRALLAELPATADPCGENGEFHTFVHGGPIFVGPLESCAARLYGARSGLRTAIWSPYLKWCEW